MIPRVWSDSSACFAIVRMQDKPNLAIRHMWTQERLQQVRVIAEVCSHG